MKKLIMFLFILTCGVGSFAQTQKSKSASTKQTKTSGVKYTCTMHPEVVSNKPGKCPKCGMNLVVDRRGSKQVVKETYSCPMHTDVVMDKPGKCPKCGMKLVKVEAKKTDTLQKL